MVTRVPNSTQAEMDSAVDAALKAFPEWSEQSVLTRQQVMFKFQNLIKGNMVSDGSLSKTSSPLLEMILCLAHLWESLEDSF